MKRLLNVTAAALLLLASDFVMTSAFARGGGANTMNSPGYQRRLQESRGYVTNQSGSLVSTQKPISHRKPRHHRKR
jgi:hypothetical protein